MKFHERVISDFGGYEKCKDILNQPNIDLIMNAQGLRAHMLEYRRQHNIFEVGDKVVFIESELKNPRLMTVIEVREPICGFLMAECSLGITNGFYPSRYRHATPEEIKAGKRLEVNQ